MIWKSRVNSVTKTLTICCRMTKRNAKNTLFSILFLTHSILDIHKRHQERKKIQSTSHSLCFMYTCQDEIKSESENKSEKDSIASIP